MIKFFARSLLAKMILLFLAVSLIPIALVATLSYWSAITAPKNFEFEKLHETADMRKTEILDFLNRTMMDTKFIASLDNIVAAAKQLQDQIANRAKGTGLQSMDSGASPEDNRTLNRDIDPTLKRFIEINGSHSSGYDDIYLVDGVSESILYSLQRRADVGTSLRSGPYRDSGLAKVSERVTRTGKPATNDFTTFGPSASQLMFMAVPCVLDTNGNVNVILVLGIKPNRIINIMKQTTGVGTSGETRLVGQDHLMRSESRQQSASFFIKKKDETKPATLALRGESGAMVAPDMLGETSLVYYLPVSINKDENLGADFDWGIIADIDEKEALAPTLSLVWRILMMALVIGAIVAVLAFFAARGVSKPIRKMAEQASSISDGNLTIDVTIEKRKDEIGELTRAFHSMVDNLRSQTLEILDGVNILMSASAEISSTTSELAASASETSSAVSETMTTVEELKQTANLSSDKARSVSERSQTAFQIAQSGKKATEETINRMSHIKGQMESIGETVVRLSEQSLSIEEIISAVKDLAEQSKLLAVNASIEAARAGEQGKGFAVVAQEIKILADQSRQATDQVRTILEDIRGSISAVVMATEQGNRAVDAGSRQSQEAGSAIEEVTKSVHDAAQALTVVVASGEQQSIGVEQVSGAMGSIDQAMRQNVEGTRQLETAARNLEQLGQRLKDFVNRFRV
ncbi:MAG: methyl-accepting chemotaxis protein [Desulfomonilaceae bacterium]|jgi:methyl-accepting chemotaxis protein